MDLFIPHLTHQLWANTYVCFVLDFHPLFASETHPGTVQT